jgi:hypothetical protein
MNAVVQVLRTVRELLAEPRRWVQGRWLAHRDRYGAILQPTGASGARPANCWCLSEAISRAIVMNHEDVGPVTFTELRSSTEQELLTTLDADERYPAVYVFNDAKKTAHADVIELLDKTLARLAPEAA